jgi:hypothetical protein
MGLNGLTLDGVSVSFRLSVLTAGPLRVGLWKQERLSENSKNEFLLWGFDYG